MEFGKLVGDSFEYAKEGLVGHWLKWIVLIILGFLPVIPIMFGVIFGIVSALTAPAMLIPIIVIMIILAIILALPLLGYTVRIYRGETPAPEVNNWGSLFSDGLKLFVILLIYAIPVIIRRCSAPRKRHPGDDLYLLSMTQSTTHDPRCHDGSDRRGYLWRLSFLLLLHLSSG